MHKIILNILLISKKDTLVKYMVVEIYIFLKHWTFYETIKLCVWLIKSLNLIHNRSRNVNIRVKIVHCATREKKIYFASVKFDARAKRG